MGISWEELKNMLSQRETVGFPFTTDADKKEKYAAAVVSLATMRDAGYLDFEATDIDSLEVMHMIVITWHEEADLDQSETQVLIDLLELNADGLYIVHEGKVWVIGVEIYRAKSETE